VGGGGGGGEGGGGGATEPSVSSQHALEKVEGSPSVAAFSLSHPAPTRAPPIAALSPRLREREQAQVVVPPLPEHLFRYFSLRLVTYPFPAFLRA